MADLEVDIMSDGPCRISDHLSALEDDTIFPIDDMSKIPGHLLDMFNDRFIYLPPGELFKQPDGRIYEFRYTPRIRISIHRIGSPDDKWIHLPYYHHIFSSHWKPVERKKSGYAIPSMYLYDIPDMPLVHESTEHHKLPCPILPTDIAHLNKKLEEIYFESCDMMCIKNILGRVRYVRHRVHPFNVLDPPEPIPSVEEGNIIMMFMKDRVMRIDVFFDPDIDITWFYIEYRLTELPLIDLDEL